jgi:predicted membrane-bound spermidine synthase
VPRSRYEPEHREEPKHRRLRTAADASAFVLLGLLIGGAIGYVIGDWATNTEDPYLDTGAALGTVIGALFGAAVPLILALRSRD